MFDQGRRGEVVDREGFLLPDAGKGAEEEMSNIGEGGGVARRDAVIGDEGQELAEGVVQAAGGLVFTGERTEFGANAVEINELLLLAGMEEAEGGMGFPAGHAAVATIGSGMETAICRLRRAHSKPRGIVTGRAIGLGVRFRELHGVLGGKELESKEIEGATGPGEAEALTSRAMLARG